MSAASSRRLLRLNTLPVARSNPALQPVLPGQPQPTAAQMRERTSYAEALEMQRKGVVNTPPCVKCASGHGRYSQCVSVTNELRGACGNCHHQSLANSCSLRIAPTPSKKKRPAPSEQDDSSSDPGGPPPPPTPRKKK